jgi:hypothetical protein
VNKFLLYFLAFFLLIQRIFSLAPLSNNDLKVVFSTNGMTNLSEEELEKSPVLCDFGWMRCSLNFFKLDTWKEENDSLFFYGKREGRLSFIGLRDKIRPALCNASLAVYEFLLNAIKDGILSSASSEELTITGKEKNTVFEAKIFNYKEKIILRIRIKQNTLRSRGWTKILENADGYTRMSLKYFTDLSARMVDRAFEGEGNFFRRFGLLAEQTQCRVEYERSNEGFPLISSLYIDFNGFIDGNILQNGDLSGIKGIIEKNFKIATSG